MTSKQEASVARSRITYECNECGKKFPAYAKLINHERVHTGEKPFVCRICCRAFRQAVHLKRHQKVHSNQRPHECGSCDRAFKLNAHLKRHTKSHHGYDKEGDADSQFAEDIASDASENDKAIPNREVLNGHVGILYECQLCSKMFKRKYNLHVHERKHAENMVFSCDVCGKGFSELQEMAFHRRSHEEEQASHNCPICNKELRSKTTLKQHIKTHSNDQPHVCDVCGAGFKQYRSLSNHKRMHSGQIKYNCDFCDKEFFRPNDLTVHRRMHTGERPFECEICSKAFKQKAHVVKHMETVHSESKPKDVSTNLEMVIEESNKRGRYTRVRSKSEVRLHKIPGDETSCADGNPSVQNGIHNEDSSLSGSTVVKTKQDHLDETSSRISSSSPNTCETCGKSFRQKSYLNVHRRIHTGEMPFDCDICGQAFRQRSHAKKHKSVMHNTSKVAKAVPLKPGLDNAKNSSSSKPKSELDTEGGTLDKEELVSKEQNSYEKPRTISKRKPFQCEICHKKFRQKGYLSVHKRIHTGEMPYKCNICQRAFRQKTHVAKHKRTVHKLRKSNSLKDIDSKTRREERQEGCMKETTGDNIFTSEYSMVGQEIFGRYRTDSSNVSSETAESNSLKCGQSSSNGKSSSASSDKPHACEICGKAFKRKPYLVIHKRMHTGERPYECALCSRSFRQDCHLRVHMAKIHPEEYPAFQSIISQCKQATYRCRFCSRVYKRKHLLKLHEKTHEVPVVSKPPEISSKLPSKDSQVRPFLCQFCPKAFKLKQHLNSHERVHTGIRPYECDVCGRAFKQSSHLVRHKKVHVEMDEEIQDVEPDVEIHKCSTCRKVFDTKKGLLCHAPKCRSSAKELTKGRSPKKKIAGKSHKCNECGKRFERKQILVNHKRSHTGEKPYKCDECGKAFAIAGNLQRHKVIHTGELPYVCDICGKGCTQKSNLEAHIRLVHNGRREVMEFDNYIRKGNKKCSEVSHNSNTNAIAKCEKQENGDTTGTYEYIKNCNETITLNGITEHGLDIQEESRDAANDGIFRCCECGKGFDKASSMMKHCVEEH